LIVTLLPTRQSLSRIARSMWQSFPTFMLGRPSTRFRSRSASVSNRSAPMITVWTIRHRSPSRLRTPSRLELIVVPAWTTHPSDTRLSLIMAPLIRAAGRNRIRV